MTTYLPANVALQYSELLQLCMTPSPDGSHLSFKKKTINNKNYWYLYISIGSRRTEHYLGEENSGVMQKIQQQQQLWHAGQEDRQLRAKTVAMLIAGGASSLQAEEGKVLGLLESSGVFLAGGVLIGTYAFQAYANMLGVVWQSGSRTHDIDLAREAELPIALDNANLQVPLKDALMQSGMGFLEVPSLNHKSPSTCFKISGKTLSVELLTPMKGKRTDPVPIKSLNAWAEPVRFLDYLLEDTQLAVLLYRHGILVHVPNPARFALHKLVVSQRRSAAFQQKADKDLAQAEMLLNVLCEHRPGDVILAWQAATQIGGKFMQQLKQGLRALDQTTQDRLGELLA